MKLLISMKKYFNYFYISLVLFVYIYSIKLKFFPVGLDKIVSFCAFLSIFPLHIKSFFRFLKRNKIVLYYYLILLFLFSYSSIIFVLNTSWDFSFLYSLLLRLTVFYFPVLFILFYIYKNSQTNDFKKKVLNILAFIIGLQSIFIIYSFFNLDFKHFVDQILPYIGNIKEFRLDRMRGISNSSGATLSLVQGIGAYICLYLLYFAGSIKERIIYLIFLSLDVVSLIFTGRSGLILFIFCSVGFLLANFLFLISLRGVKLSLTVVISFIIIYFFITHINFLGLKTKQVYIFYDEILPWAMELFENFLKKHVLITESTHELSNMLHWPQDFKTFFLGDGIFERAYTMSDSGYVRYIYNFGVIGIVILIFSIVYLFYYAIKRSLVPEKIWLLLLMLYVLFIDIKEPFLLKPQYYPLLLLILFTFIIDAKIILVSNSKKQK